MITGVVHNFREAVIRLTVIKLRVEVVDSGAVVITLLP